MRAECQGESYLGAWGYRSEMGRRGVTVRPQAVYDSNVEWCLWASGCCTNEARGLRDYGHFLRVLTDFRAKYGLQGIGPKQLDKFLYLKGRQIRDQVESEKKAEEMRA